MTLYYSNSNIGSAEEYEKRLAEVRKFAEHFGLELIVDPYDHQAWLDWVSTVENFADAPERGARCVRCFAWSLERAATESARRGMTFATTLTVSPYKNSATIFEVGGQYENFERYDFKKQDGYLKSMRLSQELGLYRQNYCGCEFSKLSSEKSKNN